MPLAPVLSFVLLACAPALVATPAEPPTSAGETEPALRYAHGSTSLIGGATLMAGFPAASTAGTAFQGYSLSGGLAVRHVFRFGLALEPRVGLDAFVVTSPSGPFAVLAGRLGLGAGWAFALGRRAAVTPMLSYEAVWLGGGLTSSVAGVAHAVSAEVPLTIFFGRRAFVEVFVRGGGATLLDQLVPVFAAGYRFGLKL